MNDEERLQDIATLVRITWFTVLLLQLIHMHESTSRPTLNQ